MTHTALAKIVAAAMVGLAVVTVFTLLWMARRLHRRGQFGGKAPHGVLGVWTPRLRGTFT